MLKQVFHRLNVEWQLLLVLGGLCVITLLINFIQTYYFLLNWSEPLIRSNSSILIEDFVLNGLIMICFIMFILYTTNYFFEKETSTYTVVGFHLFFGTISGIVAYVLAVALSLFFGSLTLVKIKEYDHIRRIFSEIDSSFLIYFSIMSIVYIYHYYKQYRESEFQRYEIENKLTATNLNLIQSQLEPHFLFNTLNSISALLYTDQDKAAKTISNLGDVLRDTLMLRDTQFVSVGQELTYLQKYIDILNVRFDGNILYEVVASEQVKSIKLPSLILQPIIENAIKHGYGNGTGKIRIQVMVKMEGERLQINVRNSGSSIKKKSGSQENSNKVGVSLVKEKLDLIYDKHSTFKLRNIRHPIYNVEVEITISEPVQHISGHST